MVITDNLPIHPLERDENMLCMKAFLYYNRKLSMIRAI